MKYCYRTQYLFIEIEKKFHNVKKKCISRFNEIKLREKKYHDITIPNQYKWHKFMIQH